MTPRRRPGRARAAALLAALAAAVCSARARAGEVCRFEGTTSHDGRVAVRAEATKGADGLTVVDVALTWRGTVWWIFDVAFLGEEITTWRGDALQSVAVNGRTLFDGRATRQQWDLFTPDAAGLQGWRVQAKTLAEFRRKHPGFVAHWDPAAFGAPWLADYAAASPERRPDLDVPRSAMLPGARTPMALAFYWTRALPPGGADVPIVLPGFKRDARSEIALRPAPASAPPLMPIVAPAGTSAGQRWRAMLRYPTPSPTTTAEAEAVLSPDRHLEQLGFEVHAPAGDAHAVVHALGCEGAPGNAPGNAPG